MMPINMRIWVLCIWCMLCACLYVLLFHIYNVAVISLFIGIYEKCQPLPLLFSWMSLMLKFVSFNVFIFGSLHNWYYHWPFPWIVLVISYGKVGLVSTYNCLAFIKYRYYYQLLSRSTPFYYMIMCYAINGSILLGEMATPYFSQFQFVFQIGVSCYALPY